MINAQNEQKKAYWMVDSTVVEEFDSINKAFRTLEDVCVENDGFIPLTIGNKNTKVRVEDITVSQTGEA
jgi:hypothetical protein